MSKAPPDPGEWEWAVHHTWVCNTKKGTHSGKAAEFSQ